MEKILITFKIKKNSLKNINLLSSQIFLLWNSIMSKHNFLVGIDYNYYLNSSIKNLRYTYSGSPHAQTKKGRDFNINSTFTNFGIILYNETLIKNILYFFNTFLFKYKSLQSGLIIKIKYLK